jgi:WD40 repeat protein
MSDDGLLFAAASGSGVAVVGDVSAEGRWLCSGHDGPIVHLAFAPAGNLLVTTGVDGTARLFGVGHLPGSVMLPHAKAVLHTDFSPDGGSIVTTARDGTARVFLLPTGEQVAEFPTAPDELLSAGFVTDDRLVLACRTGRITIVNVASGENVQSFMAPSIEMHDIVMPTTDGRWLAVCRFDEIADVFSANGDGAGPGGDERPKIERQIRRRLGSLHGRKQIIEPDRAGAPMLRSDSETVHLKVGGYQVVKARFAPDGHTIVGAALNRTDLPIFDAETGDLVAELRMAHESNDARFSTDGRWVAASWLSGVTIIGFPAMTELLTRARAQVYREPTAQERAEFKIAEDDEALELPFKG